MKPEVPAGNIIVASLYMLTIFVIAYVIKLVFKVQRQSQKIQTKKYSSANIDKGINSPLLQKHISPIKIIVHAYFRKYSIIGSFAFNNKCYLFKQLFILSLIAVTAIGINWIIIWPLVLAFAFTLIFFVSMEQFNIPFLWNSNLKIKIQQQGKNQVKQPRPQQIQVEHGLISQQNLEIQSRQQVKQTIKTNNFSFKFILSIAVISFTTLIFVSHTMFCIYNSISNTGALNIASVACVFAIDQLLLRPFQMLILMVVAKIVVWRSQNNLVQNIENIQVVNSVKSSKNLTIFQIALFKNLCQDVLINKMNEIYDLHGQPSNYQMSVSPTRKKTVSPSKIPKAITIEQSDTIMNIDLNKTDELNIKQNIQNAKSPIKEIQLSMIKQSWLFTSAQKQMFGQQAENDHFQSNKSVDVFSAQKIKVNPNQYFSAQRLPKDQIIHEENLGDDGLILVQTGLNLVKQRQQKCKQNTLDIQFSPTKKRKRVGAYPKKRQLIITGSSPYLQYLPDMMKKDKNLKKNTTPLSHQQIPTVSRKVL